jgi:hypothetical protein
MLFEDAEQKLQDIAKDRYYSLAHEVNSYTSGRVERHYKLFVDMPNLLVMSKGVGSSWEEAFENLAKDIELAVCLQEEEQRHEDVLKNIGCVMSATLGVNK